MTKNYNLLHEKYQVLENDNKYGFKLYKDGLNEKVNFYLKHLFKIDFYNYFSF
jgi:hypothetical protein